MAPVYTRFAPSPTGHLHVGGARTALFCWAFARRARLGGDDGRFLVRIEDTDQARSSDESARGILEDLAWLGILWDEGPELRDRGTANGEQDRVVGGDPRGVGPFFQARRVALYNTYVEQLIAGGRAYPAFETPEEIEALRKDAASRKQTYRYDRSRVPMEERLRRMKAGEPHAVRFVSPEDGVTVRDRVLGDVKYAPGEMDDFVIRKADGFPTYHFAVVVDDQTMGVTHVLRAQEHLNNTLRHVALQEALGFRTPEYAHMPLIFNMDGKKLGKRDKARAARNAVKKALGDDTSLSMEALAARLPDTSDSGGRWNFRQQFQPFVMGDVDYVELAEAIARLLNIPLPEIDVADFRAAGYLPEAMVNFLALLGWNPGMKAPDGKDLEKFDAAFVAEHFSLERIGKGNAKFDRAKLLAFNSERIGAMTDAEFTLRWREWAREFEPDLAAKLTERQLSLIAPAARPRCRTLRDLAGVVRFAVTPDDGFEYDAKAVEKVLRKGEPSGLVMLKAARDLVAGAEPFEPAALNRAVERLAQEKGVGMGQVAQPLRVALTGTTVSPPLGETLAVLGRDSSLARIDRCLAAHGG